MTHRHSGRVLRSTAVALMIFVATSARAQTAVAKLDINRYMGVWYEVARLPVKLEKKCVSDTVILYSLGDKRNRFQMVTSCKIKDGNPDAWNSQGKLDKARDGKLKLSYLQFLSKKYWVLATGSAYEWALVGSPNHKTLWILSRTATLPGDTLAEVKAKAAAQGFKMDKLLTTPQGAN